MSIIKNNQSAAITLIAGTTVGAGMLALPMTAINIGIVPSAFLLLGLWAVMYLSALMTARLNYFYGKGVSIVLMAEDAYGVFGKTIGKTALCLLFYALLAAYITGGASFMNMGLLHIGIKIPQFLIQFFFTLFFGVLVLDGLKSLDKSNKILVMIMGTLFLTILVALAPLTSLSSISNHDLVTTNFEYLAIAIPVFFTSFGYHGSIPVLVDALGATNRDYAQTKKAFLIGSMIPFALYMVWIVFTVGVLKKSGLSIETQDIASFFEQLTPLVDMKGFSIIIKIFSFLAVATSFVGVGAGLFAYNKEQFFESDTAKHKIMNSMITFLPPLLFACFYPGGFVMALGFAAIALSLLAIVLPVLVAFRLKSVQTNPILNVGLLLTGLGIIGLEVFNKLS